MLYRHPQGTFMVYPYRATFTVANEQRSAFVADKETFEQTLANANLVYTDLVYEDVTLTDAQLTRYRQIYLFPENEILACINYVQNGTFPSGDTHALRHIQLAEENRMLGQLVTELEIQLLELQLRR